MEVVIGCGVVFVGCTVVAVVFVAFIAFVVFVDSILFPDKSYLFIMNKKNALDIYNNMKGEMK